MSTAAVIFHAGQQKKKKKNKPANSSASGVTYAFIHFIRFAFFSFYSVLLRGRLEKMIYVSTTKLQIYIQDN